MTTAHKNHCAVPRRLHQFGSHPCSRVRWSTTPSISAAAVRSSRSAAARRRSSRSSYTRSYPNGDTISVGEGSGIDRSLGLFGRVGWVDRVTPIDEAAVYTDISRSWLIAGGYTEAANGNNPFPATVQTGLDTLNVCPRRRTVHPSLQRAVRGERQRGRRLRVRRRIRVAVERLRASAPSPPIRSRIRSGASGAGASATASRVGWSSTLSCSAPSAAQPGRPSTAA